MKALITAVITLFSSAALAKTWEIKVKNLETKEVKTYEISKPGEAHLNMLGSVSHNCIAEVENQKIKAGELSELRILCISPGANDAVTTKGICSSKPTHVSVPAYLEIIQYDRDKKGKEDEFRSAQIIAVCR